MKINILLKAVMTISWRNALPLDASLGSAVQGDLHLRSPGIKLTLVRLRSCTPTAKPWDLADGVCVFPNAVPCMCVVVIIK